ncbi:hypothetical protein CU098_013670 [Rhizopus stolonifer]|uniref:F-box domain-containing protein n=1 Tax=Rhizopus stolonifer TaxID=4846 RepID=A0A367KVN8_RHIST|nr:hypothetical protein CU098_013670 [Rhizopus stolonifer]
MNTLPYELWLPIFDSFDLKQKLACSLVCKQWYSVLTTYGILYKTIRIVDNSTRFQRLLEFFRDHPNLAKTVIRLDLQECEITSPVCIELPILFPCVRLLRFVQDEQFGYEFSKVNRRLDPIEFQTQVQKWKQLESVQEHNVCFSSLTAALLTCTQPYLHTISLNYHTLAAPYHHSYWGPLLLDRKRTLLNSLVHAPCLRTLTLYHLHLTLEDMETIHQYAPQLDTLRLVHIRLKKQREPLRPVQHTRSIKTCSLQHGPRSNHVMILAWLEYVYAKYTHLSHLEVTCDITHDAFEACLLKTVSKFNQLISYNTNLCLFTQAMADTMHVSQLTLHALPHDHLLETQLTHLANSQHQRQSLQHLSLVLSPQSYALTHFVGLGQCQQLTRLDIQSASSSVDLAILYYVASDAPQLKTLYLPRLVVHQRPIELRSVSPLALRHLNIEDCLVQDPNQVKIFNRLLGFITHQCHQLYRFQFNLNLKSCLVPSNDPSFVYSLCFDFTHCPVQQVEINTENKRLYCINQVYYVKGPQWNKIPPVHPTKYHTTLINYSF